MKKWREEDNALEHLLSLWDRTGLVLERSFIDEYLRQENEFVQMYLKDDKAADILRQHISDMNSAGVAALNSKVFKRQKHKQLYNVFTGSSPALHTLKFDGENRALTTSDKHSESGFY